MRNAKIEKNEKGEKPTVLTGRVVEIKYNKQRKAKTIIVEFTSDDVSELNYEFQIDDERLELMAVDDEAFDDFQVIDENGVGVEITYSFINEHQSWVPGEEPGKGTSLWVLRAQPIKD